MHQHELSALERVFHVRFDLGFDVEGAARAPAPIAQLDVDDAHAVGGESIERRTGRDLAAEGCAGTEVAP